MKKQWLVAVLMGVALGVTLTLIQARDDGPSSIRAQTPAADGQDVADGTQPFDFPHDRHVQDFQIDCQYCHFSAERSPSAGVPPLATCMGCHSFVAGTERPEDIAIVREFAQRGEAIPWDRSYKVSDHVQFPHMRHVSAGVDCATCHGDVGEIGVIEEVEQPLTMGWCVSCHVERGASRDCTVCHY